MKIFKENLNTPSLYFREPAKPQTLLSHHIGISSSRTPLKQVADGMALIANQDNYEVDPKRSLAITQKILEGWRTLSDLICRNCRNVLFGDPRTKNIECLWCERPYQMSDQSIHSRPELRYSSTKVLDGVYKFITKFNWSYLILLYHTLSLYDGLKHFLKYILKYLLVESI